MFDLPTFTTPNIDNNALLDKNSKSSTDSKKRSLTKANNRSNIFM